MEVGMNIDDYLDDEQLKVVGLIGVVIVAMAAGPILLAPSDDNEIEPNKGTVVTPDGTELQEVDSTVDRGPLGGLNAIPTSHLQDDESPTVYASAGSQTMRVETTTVGGDPALNLSDERTHDGRWVSVPTEWFNQTQGEVPAVARIAHEENGTYTEAIQVRGDSAAFYVRGFSTNTVTFGGELVIRDQPAVDGTRHTYQLDSRDSVNDVSINLTGVENAAPASASGNFSDGDTVPIDVGGTTAPRNESVTFTGTRSSQTKNKSGQTSDGSIALNITGNQNPENVQITYDNFGGSTSETTTVDSGTYTDSGGHTTVYNSQTNAPYSYVENVRISYNNEDEEGDTGYVSGDGHAKLWVDGELVYDGGIRLSKTATTFPVDKAVADSNPNIRLAIKSFTYKSPHWFTVRDVTVDSGNPALNVTDENGKHTLQQGDTQTLELADTTDSLSTSVVGGKTIDYSIGYDDVTATEDPSITVDGSTVSHTGLLADGETVTEPIDLTTGPASADISASGPVEVSLEWTEVTQTVDPVVEVNGNSVSHSGTLADGETASLDANSSWLQDGQNNITVQVGDGSVTSGPEPQVELEYRHDLESPRTVDYESEALSERYNISKTYTTPRANATLTVPHARTVLSMRALEYRLNETGSWASVPQSAANLSGTTLNVDVSELAGDPVPEGTTIEVRSTGSRVDAHDSEISVVRATPVGFDMDSRVRLESWNSGSYLEVGETPQGGLVYYAENESYSAESDYVELYSDGSQRFYAPNATSGSELTLNTLSARVEPDRNSMRVRVPESANATNTEFVVEPASVVGDAWTAEYVAGTDGQWYAVVDSAGTELGAAEKPDPIEVSRDDVGFVSIEPTDPPSASTSGAGGGVFATFTSGNLPSLLVLFGGVGMLFVAGTRPQSSRDAIDGIAAGVGGLFERIPRVGSPIGSAVESALSAVGSGLVSVGENRLLTGTVGAAVVVAAAEAGLFTIGSEAGAILAVGGIAVGSLWLLRESGEFTTARWIAIVAVAGVVALQGLGEGDLLSEFVNSDAFLIAVLIGGYAAIQLVREYRANNSPDDDRPQVIIGGRFRSGSGDDQEGSD